MFHPKGIYPALMTPFTDDFKINKPELERLVEFGLERGLDGIFPVSSVGEGVHLDFDEKCRCMKIVVDQVDGRVPVTPGVVATSPHECVRLARYASSIGCSAVVITPPYFYKPQSSMVEQFFETIIEQGGIDVILYNIPLFTSPLDHAMVARLSRFNNVVGMKDSSGSMVDFMHFMDTIRCAGHQVSMLTGREETLLAALYMGAEGCMTATAGIFPEMMVGIYQAFLAGDHEKALTLQREILVIIRAMFAAPFPIGFKLALEIRGFKMGPPLLPPAPADIEQIEIVRAQLKEVMDPVLEKYCTPAAS